MRNGNKRVPYQNFEKCIWHIQANSPNRWLKLRVKFSHIEYDEHCGLDKVHIFEGPIPKRGFTDRDEPVARICGGSIQPGGEAGKGPKKTWGSFHDGTTKLTKYPDKDCPKKKGSNTNRPCKQEGWDSWIFLKGNNVTIAFESDQTKTATGFTIEWGTYGSLKPTPPPPDVKKSNKIFLTTFLCSETFFTDNSIFHQF